MRRSDWFNYAQHMTTYLTGVELEPKRDVLERVPEVTTHPSGPADVKI